MSLCPACYEYPEGTACTMTGCPGRKFKIAEWPQHERPDMWTWGDGIRLAESARAELRGSTIGPASDVVSSFHESGPST